MDQTIRERTESLERQTLSPRACLSASSRGRAVEIAPCPMRTCFQRDIDRVVHCKSFRRLKHKTQVFLQPEGDHYRTRMTHTLEVSRIARTMARGLALNEDLAEAAALAHDLGHTPFGHAGERALSRMVEGGFRHYEQSLRVVDRLENDGAGLNLCHEVRDGILCHTAGRPADTLEGQLVRFADKIAYINHDIDDAMRGGVIFPTDIPAHISQTLGYTHGDADPGHYPGQRGGERHPPVPTGGGGHGGAEGVHVPVGLLQPPGQGGGGQGGGHDLPAV